LKGKGVDAICPKSPARLREKPEDERFCVLQKQPMETRRPVRPGKADRFNLIMF
jgi:hypothetical protein